MFVKKSTHDAVVAELAAVKTTLKAVNAELDRTTSRLVQVREEKRMFGKCLDKALNERDEARAELAPLKAARERSLANLSAWNARRKAAVRENA